MKRTFLLILVSCFFVPALTAQITGTGTFANPYRGIGSGDFTIVGTKYFDNNFGVSAGTLTLMPSSRLICKSRYASIVISGTGRISATGTGTRRILITGDTDGDMIAGESSDLWGNILLTSTGTSNFSYVTVENGMRTRFSYTGGAIHIGSGTVNISNSIIRNSAARQGGAIYLEAGANVTVSNSVISGNSATESGGAIYMTAGSAPVISSCVFYDNSSSSALVRGGAIAAFSSSPVIVNSTFVNNTSAAGDGAGIYLENSPDAKVVNSIFWGGPSQTALSGTPTTVFEFCAIEGNTYAGCLTLNSSNTAADGPNFTDPSTGDLTIAFASPLRDTGADSYSGLNVPPTDIIGSGRVYVTDIGAYEMIYSRWLGGNANWGDPVNWDAGFVPGSTNVVIPAGTATYPTAAPGPSFTLNAGLQMIMQPGSKATFSSITNNGTIDLLSDATGQASLMTNSYSGSAGNLNIGHFLTSGPTGDWWHYIAAPTTVSKTVFTDIEPELLVRYDETKVISDIVEGWQWHDGYGGTTPFSNLTAKEGYDVSVATDVTMTYRNLKSLTTSIGRIDLPFGGSGKDTAMFGYSLIGNSLTCGINWDQVAYSHEHKLIRHGYYIRTSSGEEASYVMGVGTNGATAHIAPLQGFFVRTRSVDTYITIADSAREHNDAPRFKSAEQIPLLRLTLSSAAARDEMVIRFDPEATLGFDGHLDAGKPFTHLKERMRLYSVLKGENYSINSIPWPSERTVIPVTLEIPGTGTFKITRTQLQNTGEYRFILTDTFTGKSTDMTTNAEYAFTATAGTIAGRFTLTVTPPEIKAATVTEEEKPEIITESSLRIYSTPGRICILPQGSDWEGVSGTVRIYDITGRTILASDNERFNSGELNEYFPGNAGNLIIVEVTAGAKRYLEKVFLAR
jgi:predicted outer membrane repeat protein